MHLPQFLTTFASDRAFRKNCLAQALANQDAALNDLAFLAAVHTWKDKHDGGKKKAVQIGITFCIRVRGGGTPNPYAISLMAVTPPPQSVTLYNAKFNTQARAALVEVRRNFDNQITRNKNEVKGIKGNFTAAFLSLKQKATAHKRKVDLDLFDGIVADITIAGSPIALFAAPILGATAMNNAAPDPNDAWTQNVSRLMQAHDANLDLQYMGMI
jgi:hypothetical protein